MDNIDSRSYPAIIVFGIGSVLILIANFVLKDAHVTTFEDAITRLTSGEIKDMLILWACALFGLLLQTTGTFMQGKLSLESIKYHSYESNPVLNIIITLIIALVTVISAYYTSIAVMGLIIIVAIILLIASSNNSQK